MSTAYASTARDPEPSYRQDIEVSGLSPLRDTYEDDEAGGKEEGPSRVEVEAVNEDMLAEKPKVEKPAVLPATVHGLADVSQIEMCSGKGCRMSRAQGV